MTYRVTIARDQPGLQRFGVLIAVGQDGCSLLGLRSAATADRWAFVPVSGATLTLLRREIGRAHV